jgi:uncharacterized protein (TIGR01244 family)
MIAPFLPRPPAIEINMSHTILDDQVAVRGQLRPEEIAALAAAGFKGIINNRPDSEGPDQPSSLQLEAEAKRHGLLYWYIPIVPGQATAEDGRAFAKALQEAGGLVLAFCRTGARATGLWNMTQQDN